MCSQIFKIFIFTIISLSSSYFVSASPASHYLEESHHGLDSSDIERQVVAIQGEKIHHHRKPEPEVPAEVPAWKPKNTFHVIGECVMMSMDEGVYHYKSRGSSDTCGLYLVADPDKSIIVTVDYLNAPCQTLALISVVDGWELNGQLFPSPEDHEKNFEDRFDEMCGSRKRMKRSFTSSQNAALVQYRLPEIGQGFTVRVQHIPNPRPCNVLVQNTEAVFTLENYGRRINCSLTTLFDAKMRTIYMSTGLQGSKVNIPSFSQPGLQIETLHKCGKMGLTDYVQIGGSSGLDTSQMEIIEEFCGYDPNPANSFTTIFCGVTTVRLVSSGMYQNKIVIEVLKAEEADILSANYFCDL